VLRIELAGTGNGLGEATLRATGRLVGPWVAELERALASHAPAAPVVLDLTEVSFADRTGIEFLRTLRHDPRLSLRCSPFVAAQLI